MEIQEKLVSCHVLHDDKARRVLNTAPSMRADITAAELAEAGVTIERLEALRVPVYSYATQITIHGTFPEAIPYGVGGYKNLVRNGNGSLGVRYSAVDMGKKRTLEAVSRYAKTGWHVSITSSDCQCFKMFYPNHEAGETLETAKAAALACYKSTPDHLYIGGKWAGSLLWGAGYVVVIELGAIYERHVWELARVLFGHTPGSYEAAKAQEEREQAERSAQYEAEVQEERARMLAQITEGRSALEAAGYKPAASYTPGYYVKPNGREFLVIRLDVDKFHRMLRRARKAATLAEVKPFTPDKWEKAHVIDPKTLKGYYSLSA